LSLLQKYPVDAPGYAYARCIAPEVGADTENVSF